VPVAEVLDLLRCPLCGAPFTDVGGGVRCASGHRFDLARQGYLNLLGGPPPRHADTAAMVAARERFLGAGGYRPVAEALLAAARDGLETARDGVLSAPALLEVGAGTGYYTAALLDGLGGRGLALDISVAAARRAARAHPRVAAVVADVWTPLPLADAAVDVLACVFAPRNPREFARVLRPDGVLVVVTPLPQHLQELRAPLGLLEVEEDKQDRLAGALSAQFDPLGAAELRYAASWSAPTVVDLVAMGPNAFHVDPDALVERVAALTEPVPVTVAVSVTTWLRTPEPAPPV
jgi:23S rRNA (guanine745-N1)-methyltransferase